MSTVKIGELDVAMNVLAAGSVSTRKKMEIVHTAHIYS